MSTYTRNAKSRRRFLQMLAASPLLPYVHLPHSILKALQQEQNNPTAIDDVLHVHDPDGVPPSVMKSVEEYDGNLSSAKSAITVFDLEAVARKKLNPGHLAYLWGDEDGATYVANREGFTRFQLRPRRLIDISKVDSSVTLFGTKWDTPIYLCPVGFQKPFNPEGELATARAAKATGHLQFLSSSLSQGNSLENVTAARGAPVLTQMSHDQDWSITLGRIKRAEAAGCPAIFVAIEVGGGKREVLARVRRQNAALCSGCHTLIQDEGLSEQALSGPGLVMPPSSWATTKPVGPPMPSPPLTWDWVKRVKDATTMKLILKGVQTREDAELAIQHGVDVVYVSNHGGRDGGNTGRGSIECLSEVVAGVARRAPVFIDSGFRRGTDIYKALAMGATAVGVGRPYIWGLASFGQEGVEAAMNILTAEFQMVMRQMGVTSLANIKKDSVIPRPA